MKYKIILIIIAAFAVLCCISSYFGWYGYEKWKYRTETTSIDDAKRRGVFVKELHFKIENFNDTLENFHVYIEKGFHFGHESMDQTTPLIGNNYPYQISFNFQTTRKQRIYLKREELKKFDSFNTVRGYLRYPILKDTITYNLSGEVIDTGIIKVWD